MPGFNPISSFPVSTTYYRYILVVADVSQSQGVDVLSLDQIHPVLIDNILQTQSVDAQTINQTHPILINAVNQSQVVDAVGIDQLHNILIDAVNQSQFIGEPAIVFTFKGRLQAHITMRTPGVQFDGRAPETGFDIRTPRVTFTGE